MRAGSGLPTSRLPSLDDGGEALRLAPVHVEDLLLRPGVKIDYRRLETFVQGKSILVTGGGGSIGAEICDRIVTFGATRLLVVENSEPALHAVLEMLATKQAAAQIEGRLADVRDRDRIFRLIADFRPDIVFHAAALKHVPLLERDWGEGVKTNVFGSVNVADAAAAAGAAAMVMISTDKAIEPVSVLGASKRFAEMYCQALDSDFARARQRAARGDAADRGALRQCARVERLGGAQVQGADRGRRAGHRHPSRHGALLHDHPRGLRSGDHRGQPRARNRAMPASAVYVLNMGQPVKIVDLAERMIRLSGLRAGSRHRYHLYRHPAGRAPA